MEADTVTNKTENAIELGSVSKRYGAVTVVNEIDIQIRAGECFVLVGHNGAGKTTLMKIMLGLTRPDTGQVKILGENPASRSFAVNRQLLGYLPESVSFYPHMKGLELLSHYARLKKLSMSEVSLRLEQVGLSHAANRRISTYSKGMRQRLGLAQALLGAPKLLFLDEPTTGLDPLLRHDFYQIIGELQDKGTTIIISSHALNEIEMQADRIAIIKQGKLEACGSLKELSSMLSLPVRIQVSVSSTVESNLIDKITTKFNVDSIDDRCFSLLCDEGEKMQALRYVTEMGDAVEDVSISTPHLDEIYLHFMNRE
jgi:Cu-processing system ATP-binding protein